MAHNFTVPLINTTYVASPWGVFQYANLITDNAFGIVLLFTMSIIALVFSTSNFGMKRGFSMALFFSWITSLFLRLGDVVQSGVVVTTTLILVTWLGFMYYNNYRGKQ